jgi:hypothetical protein
MGAITTFAVQFCEVRASRCDYDFHHPEFRNLLKKIEGLPDTALISEIVNVSLATGFAAGKQDRVNSDENVALQIRPTQILPNGEIDLSDAYSIALSEINDADKLIDGEVLFNNTNSTSWVGKSAVFYGVENSVVCSNHVTRLRLRPDIEAEFVVEVLNALQHKKYFARLCTNFNNQAGVNSNTLASVRIPLPKSKKRAELIAMMDAARASRKAKLGEAETLLAGFDGFLLGKLGLNAPPNDTRKIFAVRLDMAKSQSHLNSDYFHPERILALRAMEQASKKIPCLSLHEIVEFERNPIKTPVGTYLSLAHVQSHTGELVEANEEASGGCVTFQQNDVLFARLRPYLNKVYCAEIEGCCSPEFHVLRIREGMKVRSDYLAVILRSRLILAQTIHMMTGNTHPRLTNEDVVNLVIPVPDLELQDAIAAEVRRRREAARRLRLEAETEWAEAKARFEAALLGEPSP